MQTTNLFQTSALLTIRIITASIFLHAGYAKIPFWSDAPEGITGFMLGVTRFLSIAEPLGALAWQAMQPAGLPPCWLP